MPFQEFLPASTRLYLASALVLESSIDMLLAQAMIGSFSISNFLGFQASDVFLAQVLEDATDGMPSRAARGSPG